MLRVVCVLLLSVLLSGCVAAIGNRGYSQFSMSPQSRPLLEERVEAARRVLELQQRRLDDLRIQAEAGRAGVQDLIRAEIDVEEARIRLLQFRAELVATPEKEDD